MKKIFLKLNLALILVMILFANVSFAEERILIDFSGTDYVGETRRT